MSYPDEGESVAGVNSGAPFPAEGYKLLTELLGEEWVVLYKPKGSNGQFRAVSRQDAWRTAEIIHLTDQRLSWPRDIPLGEPSGVSGP